MENVLWPLAVKIKSKVQTVLKSTKHLHEHTIHLLIYVHACILRASLCKKARYRDINFDVCLVELKMFGKWSQMSQNLNSIFFLWIDLTYKGFVRTAFNSVFDLVSLHDGLFSGYIMYSVRWNCHTAIHLKYPKLS